MRTRPAKYLALAVTVAVLAVITACTQLIPTPQSSESDIAAVQNEPGTEQDDSGSWCTVKNGYGSSEGTEKALPDDEVSHGDLVWETLMRELTDVDAYGGQPINTSSDPDTSLTIIVVDDFKTIIEPYYLEFDTGIIRVVPVDISYGISTTVETAVWSIEEVIIQYWEPDALLNAFVVNMSWVLLPCNRAMIANQGTPSEYLGDGILAEGDNGREALEALMDAFKIRGKGEETEFERLVEAVDSIRGKTVTALPEYTYTLTYHPDIELVSRSGIPPIFIGVAASGNNRAYFGNDHEDFPMLPAFSESIISVSASDRQTYADNCDRQSADGSGQNGRANYSNRGGVLMPGDPPCIQGKPPTLDNGERIVGTSFAAPKLAAAIAYYLLNNASLIQVVGPEAVLNCKDALLAHERWDMTTLRASWGDRSWSDIGC